LRLDPDHEKDAAWLPVTWDDVDAVKRFAGEDFELARYYDFDRAFLLEPEPKVLHYTVYDD
jgi:hypothetical protein